MIFCMLVHCHGPCNFATFEAQTPQACEDFLNTDECTLVIRPAFSDAGDSSRKFYSIISGAIREGNTCLFQSGTCSLGNNSTRLASSGSLRLIRHVAGHRQSTRAEPKADTEKEPKPAACAKSDSSATYAYPAKGDNCVDEAWQMDLLVGMRWHWCMIKLKTCKSMDKHENRW